MAKKQHYRKQQVKQAGGGSRRGRQSGRKGFRWNYPRRGLGPIRRWLPSWRFLLGCLLIGVVAIIVAFVTLYMLLDIPKPEQIAAAQRTTVYYEDGEEEMGAIYDYDRTAVSLDTLPDYVGNAVVASEDRTFYTNNGIDLGGIARAAINNLRGGARQGGSTLTQQYVENYYLGQTTDYLGKLREAVLAVKVDNHLTKQEILENYLNTIYFGRGAYGIQAAAERYFGVRAADLTLDQAALLTAIIPAPSAWDPAINPDQAEVRFDRVIRRMVDDKYITEAQAAAAKMPETIAPKTASDFSGPSGYLLDQAQKELIATGKFTDEELRQGGFHIITTIDAKKQQAAIDTVNNLPDDRPENNYVGILSADPRNGEIYAMYGGADYQKRQRNAVTQDRAQAGSTFKPFTLLAALEQDYSPQNTYFDSRTPLEIGNIKVQNYDGVSRGRVNMLTGTQHSINTYFVQLNQKIGPANTARAAVQAGLPENTPGLDDSLTNVLGSASPRSIDMTQAYATWANRGMYVPLHIVREVRDSHGKVVYTTPTKGERKIDENIADNMNWILQATARPGGTAEKVAKLGRPVAGKTGTSSGPWSAWYIGYTPQMITTINMYQIGPNGEEEVLTPFGKYWWGIGGNNFPVDMWMDYMTKATDGMEVMDFAKPGPIAGRTPDTDRIEEEQPQIIEAPSAQPEESPEPEVPQAPEPERPAAPGADDGKHEAPERPGQPPVPAEPQQPARPEPQRPQQPEQPEWPRPSAPADPPAPANPEPGYPVPGNPPGNNSAH
ncbi:transglycosylase domain-containing protein [Actinobaculum suis]|uniref:transglycosylase domain-containing protein n=1 Tax=Actinobaculum suis TaxID=1657 RepID=UPI0009E23835|nr:transglycosylase domain-containing protein [Actinobaculum suis]